MGSEIRFFRYKDSLTWPSESECLIGSDFKDWPTGLKGDAFATRIRLKNYRYRSPEQIQKRLDVRRKHTERGLFPQEMKYRWKELSANLAGSQDFWNWKSRVADSKQLDYDNQDGHYIIREELMPSMVGILEGYDIKITPKNFFRYYIGRPIKRKMVGMGFFSQPFSNSRTQTE